MPKFPFPHAAATCDICDYEHQPRPHILPLRQPQLQGQ